jgi:hypothetical protein
MPQSTPIDQLQDTSSKPEASADEERVRRILAEMSAEGSIQQPPGITTNMPRVITEAPITLSTGDLRMDANTSRAHVIGGSTPSMADFQSMFQQMSPGMAPIHGERMVPDPAANKKIKKNTWKTVSESFMESIRSPLAVAVIMFLLNLPVVTNILSRYVSWMYLSSGEISIGGLMIKSLLAAVFFATYQGISVLFEKE